MEMMKAAVWKGSRGFDIEQVAKPLIEENDILLKVKAVGVCGTDLQIYKGGIKWRSIQPPKILGHEIAGEIAATGAGATSHEIGAPVVVRSYVECHHCEQCLTGNPHLCDNMTEIGLGAPGGFAEYLKIPRANVYAIPAGLGFVEACMVQNVAEPLHALDAAGIGPGETVAVIGCGPIGMCFVQLCVLRGASRVIAVGRRRRKLELARALGADEVIDAAAARAEQRVMETTEGRGVDHVIVAASSLDAFPVAVRIAAKKGRVTLFGIPDIAVPQLDIHTVVVRELTLAGSQSASPLWEYQEALRLMSSGRVKVAPLITHRFRLDEINDAFRTATTDRENVLKTVITV